jgi:hypothetical protein
MDVEGGSPAAGFGNNSPPLNWSPSLAAAQAAGGSVSGNVNSLGRKKLNAQKQNTKFRTQISSCLNCGSADVVNDNIEGTIVCTGCGLVLQGGLITEDAEWRTFKDDEPKTHRAEKRNHNAYLMEDESTYLGTSTLGGTKINQLINQVSNKFGSGQGGPGAGTSASGSPGEAGGFLGDNAPFGGNKKQGPSGGQILQRAFRQLAKACGQVQVHANVMNEAQGLLQGIFMQSGEARGKQDPALTDLDNIPEEKGGSGKKNPYHRKGFQTADICAVLFVASKKQGDVQLIQWIAEKVQGVTVRGIYNLNLRKYLTLSTQFELASWIRV